MQRFAKTPTRRRQNVEHRAELLYVCKADARHTRLPRAMHRHDDCVEVVFILEGNGSHIIDGRTYATGQGDILVYNAGVLHDESANPHVGMSVFCCAFRNLKRSGLSPNRLTHPDAPVVYSSGPFYADIKSLLDILYTHVGQDYAQAPAFCDQLLQALIALLSQVIDHQAPHLDTRYNDLGLRAKTYIDDHYLDDIDLDTLSEQLRVSPYHLSRRFRQSVGCSPIQYLIRRRIGEAQSLLINTDLSVTDIAIRVGYDNSNYFHTAFKKVVGVTPVQYRKQCVQ